MLENNLVLVNQLVSYMYHNYVVSKVIIKIVYVSEMYVVYLINGYCGKLIKNTVTV